MRLKNKFIVLLLIAFSILLVVPSIVNAEETYIYQDETQGIEWSYEIDNSENVINLKCNTTSVSGTIIIPSTIDDRNVISIGYKAFENMIGITEITIPSTVKEIGYSAFEDCSNLSSVNLGNVEEISYDAFKGCTSLTSITIPKSLKDGAISPVFTDCTNLTSITLEEGLTVVPSNLCATTGITEITIPSTVKEIGYSAFEDCTNLSSVNLGNIETILFDVFAGCTSLTSITIPKSLKNGSISPIFTDCTNLTSITLEEGLTVVPSNLCATTGITEITIPNTVERIEYSAFEDCAQLEKITILDNVETIGITIQEEDSVFVNHNENLTIYCYEGSVAAEYAIEKNIKYVYLQRPTEDEEQNPEDTEIPGTTPGGEDNNPSETPKDENNEPDADKKDDVAGTEDKKDNTTAPEKLPNTGKFAVFSILVVTVVAGIISFTKAKKYKGI